jgi:hypothetical protein
MNRALRVPICPAINKNMTTNNEFDNYHDKSELDGPDPEFNQDAHRWDKGGLVTADNGIADRLLQNDKLYSQLKGDWKREDFNLSKNIKVTTGREGGKMYLTREQMNIPAIMQHCKEYRARAEAGYLDPLAPIMPDGKLGYKWMELPEVMSFEISNKYFGGMPWAAIKRDRTLKAQFYKVVQQEYPAFVCYPGGKLPIPVDVPYPNPMGSDKFFKGHRA